MRPEIRFTPPRRARRRIAGLVIPEYKCQQVQKTLKETPLRTLDVVTKNLAVALGSALSESLSSFTASRHVIRSGWWVGGGGGGAVVGVVGVQKRDGRVTPSPPAVI